MLFYIKLLRSLEIQIICKHFGFKYGEYSTDAEKSYFYEIFNWNTKNYLFFSNISCKTSSDKLSDCEINKHQYELESIDLNFYVLLKRE